MITFKQLEALHWIAQLGGFAPAARRLNTTQSAISKRIQELESAFDARLFDRSGRRARLTEKGDEAVALARELLDRRDGVVERLSRPAAVVRRLRIGVTELTAMTWLPRLVETIQQHYPKVIVEPDVDQSVHLRDKLLSGEEDLIIVPDAFSEPTLASSALARVENAWMCRPGLLPRRKVITLSELARCAILTQGGTSGTGIVYARWMRSRSLKPSVAINSNSMVALIGLTVSGLGVSYLPRRCLSGLIDQGLLEVVSTKPALPDVPYVAMYQREQRSALVLSIVALARRSCDFTRVFQTTPMHAATLPR